MAKNIFAAKQFIQSLTNNPGVYQMFDSEGQLLYVGKARDLKKRVSSYFQKTLSSQRLVSLVEQIHHIEVIITHNENEALLLENQLIKKLQPRYNILLRDDKTYPYIVLTKHAFPRLIFRRGEKEGKDNYFGPYPSITAVRSTMKLIQKIFKLRTCQDSFFQHRSRPCLLYQIKKCSGPCVNKIDQQQYQQDMQNAILLLSGKNQQVIENLIKQMEVAAENQNYEAAAELRDQIAGLRKIQAKQSVATESGEADIFVAVSLQGIVAVQLLNVRNGDVVGNKIFYPKVPIDSSSEEILAAFIPQFYLDQIIPKEIIISNMLPEQRWLEDALSDSRKKRVAIIVAKRGEKFQWLKIAEKTAKQAILAKLADQSHYRQRLEALQKALNLSRLPLRMECFDISHHFGEATVASCVVFDKEGPKKNAYRRFNITGIQQSDDYAALYQALSRRYKRIKEGEINRPDILFIDGGKGQLTQAEKVLSELGIADVKTIGIAKGTTRKPGLEQLFISGNSQPVLLASDSPALHLIQHIRDEAHRFALAGHQLRRAKIRHVSALQEIPGIGPKRRREILRQLGGLQEVKRASVEDLMKVPGISPLLAQRIYNELHK